MIRTAECVSPMHPEGEAMLPTPTEMWGFCY